MSSTRKKIALELECQLQNDWQKMNIIASYTSRGRQLDLRKKLQESESYRKQHQNRVVANKKKKLHENDRYRQVHQIMFKQYMLSRLQNNQQYREIINAKVRRRGKLKHNQGNCRASQTNRIIAQQTSCWKNKWAAQRRYWTRRTRLLAAARNQQRLLTRQNAMQRAPSVSMLYIKLLLNKAQQCTRKATSKLHILHNSLSEKVNACLEKLLCDSSQDEAQISAAFGDVRTHTPKSEP